ncbi:MAG TPA: sugar nucleotide-binding protein [Opitutaceae bacterium]|nr:sugar nucleotide-binding protein [Opitutaceae bacterium]
MLPSPPPAPHRPLQLWGGVECSQVRIHDEVREQLHRSGHRDRVEDLEQFATLGIRALRYPLLWERHGADPEQIDWRWADERLNRLRALGIRPIVGFVHHGGGALPGGLLDEGFVAGLARFARAVAERFPWIDAYTPINEPNTTARFSGLYGLWHPHGRSAACFGRCFLNECLAIRAAMKEIRAVNPAAELIQTEDVGKIHSTPKLAYQAEYENERRWLTFDLLCGRIDRDHLVRDHLLHSGVPEADLESFNDDPCPPDILGMNYYVTGERFLDERLERYPRRTHGGNGRDAYADVDAVRVRAEGLVGAEGLMRELWERFRRPIALTEVQLACTREEQARWVVEIWRGAEAARAAGADIRAVTLWSLLGAYDWDSLLLHARGRYESGAFDVRGPRPRRTAVATIAEALAKNLPLDAPWLASPGWWRRPVRLEYPPVAAPVTGAGTAFRDEPPAPAGTPPLVVLGARGTLGRAFLRLCELRGLPAIGLLRSNLDLADAAAVRLTLEALRPWAVVNCAGYVRVDEAERDETTCRRENTTSAANVATACAELGAKLATFSSDLVFDGASDRACVESSAPAPLNVYGRSKLEAEQRVAALHPAALIVRTSAFFGPWDDHNFAAHVLRALNAGRRVPASTECIVSPTYVPELVNATLDLLIDGAHGLWHLANGGAVSWFAWAQAIARAVNAPLDRVRSATPAELGWVAPRPRLCALASERGALLSSWEEALERCLAALAAEPRASIAA